MRGRRPGFTLLEVLVALALTSLVFAIASQTLFSCVRVATAIRESADETTAQYRFLTGFRHIIGLLIQEPSSFDGSSSVLNFTVRRPDAPQPVRITFAVRTDDNGNAVVWQKEETLFTKHTVVFPAWRPGPDAEVSFSYSNGDEWSDSWEDKEQLPAAVAVRISSPSSSFLFPVRTKP